MYHKVWKCTSDGVLVYPTQVYVAPTKVTSGAIVCLFGTAVLVSLSTWHFNLAPKVQRSSVSKLHSAHYHALDIHLVTLLSNFKSQIHVSKNLCLDIGMPWSSDEDAPPAELSARVNDSWPSSRSSPIPPYILHLPNCAARVNLRSLQVGIVGVYK